MSVLGQKQTYASVLQPMSAFPSNRKSRHVQMVMSALPPESDHKSGQPYFNKKRLSIIQLRESNLATTMLSVTDFALLLIELFVGAAVLMLLDLAYMSRK